MVEVWLFLGVCNVFCLFVPSLIRIYGLGSKKLRNNQTKSFGDLTDRERNALTTLQKHLTSPPFQSFLAPMADTPSIPRHPTNSSVSSFFKNNRTDCQNHLDFAQLCTHKEDVCTILPRSNASPHRRFPSCSPTLKEVDNPSPQFCSHSFGY